jgi:hypothetical protein
MSRGPSDRESERERELEINRIDERTRDGDSKRENASEIILDHYYA